MEKIFTEKYRPKEFEDMVGLNPQIPELVKDGNIPHLLFIGSAGTGKCVTGESRIIVNNTITTFEEYSKFYNNGKDNILSHNKKNTTGTYVELETDKTIKISLSNGNYLEGTPEHRIKIFSEKKGIIWKRLDEINKDEIVLQSMGYKKFNKDYIIIKNDKTFSVQSRKEKIIPKETIIDEEIGYLLGIFLGNGSIHKNTITISTNNEKIQNNISDIILKKFNINVKIHKKGDGKRKCGSIIIHSVGLTYIFRKLNLNQTARFKDIPIEIRMSPRQVQEQCIKGLIDTDSYFSNKEISLDYYSASKKMIYSIYYMLMNMGCYCRIKKKFNKEYNHNYYTISFYSEFLKSNFWLLENSLKYSVSPDNLGKDSNIRFINKKLSEYVSKVLKNNNFTRNGKYKSSGKFIKVDKIYSFIKRNKNSTFQNFKKNFELSKQKEINNTLQYININNTFFVGIEKINILNEKKKVYDFHIPSNHTFICNSLINHNTTAAKIIIKKLDAEALVLNASKDRGIDVIRNKIEPFATKKSSKLKIVFLDEFDHTTPAFQTALRNFMETHSRTTRFIATCNYPSKIIEPLHSRFSKFQFNGYNNEDKYKYIKKVIEQEKIIIDKDAIMLLIDKYKDDLRGIINFLNQNKYKEITVEDISQKNIALNILKKLRNNLWFEIRQELLQLSVDYESLLEEMDKIVFNHDKLSIDIKRNVNTIIADGMFQMHFSFNKELAFSAILAKLQGALN